MTEITLKLAPYWFEPEGQEEGTPAKFKLRPLTQPQMAEVTDKFREGTQNVAAFYHAGLLAIVDAENITLDGEEIKLPRDVKRIPWEWVFACGVDVYIQSQRLDDEDAEKN